MAQQTQPIIIGADVDSRFIELYTHHTGQHERIDNEPRALRAWLSGQPRPICLAVEATGRYHLALVELAHGRGHTVYLLNPFHLHHYRHSVGVRAKTDRCDARLLARYLAHERHALRAWTPPPPGQRAAWQLLKRRAKLVQAREMLQQSFAELPGMKRQVRAVLARMDALQRKLEQRLHAHIHQLGWGAAYQRCRSIYGIGPLAAAALVIAYHRGSFTSADAFVAFLGLDIRVRESGRFVGRAKLTKQGDGEYRRVLYNAAMSAARGDLRGYYQRLRARGMKSTQALVAVSRKLVRIGFSVIKYESTYDPARYQVA